MSQLGGPLPKNEDEKEKMKIGYRYGEARDKFLDELPVVGALRENQRKISKFEAEQYAKREAEGGVGNWLLNRYSDGADVAGQVLASPFTAASEVFNIDPRLLGDVVSVVFAKKMLDKSPAAHRYMHDRGVYARGTVNRMASDVKAVTNLVDKGLQRAGVRPRIYKGAKKPTVNNSQAYKDLVRDYPTTTNSMGGFVPKAFISDRTYGGYLRDYPKGTGMTGAGSGAEYIALRRAEAGQVPDPRQPVASLSTNINDNIVRKGEQNLNKGKLNPKVSTVGKPNDKIDLLKRSYIEAENAIEIGNPSPMAYTDDSIKAEKLTLREKGKEIIDRNAARGVKLRKDLPTQFQTEDGRWYSYDQVTESHKKGTLPGLKPIYKDETGKLIDTKAAKQLPITQLEDFITKPVSEGGVKWPDFVPEKARNINNYNKWIRQKYYRGYQGTKEISKKTGIPHETGHAQADIGMNPWVGAQVKYGLDGNQTLTQFHQVVEGDTIESIAAKYGLLPKWIKTKKGGIKPGEKLKIQTLRTNIEDSRLPSDLEAVDMGGETRLINQFKAFEEYIFSFAPDEIKSKVLTTTIDTHSAGEMGTILHDSRFPTAESARFQVDLDRAERSYNELIREKNPINQSKPKKPKVKRKVEVLDLKERTYDPNEFWQEFSLDKRYRNPADL